MDLYYLRKLVRPGGLIVLDDFDKPPVRAAIRYFEGNLGWSALPGVAGPRCRALRLPDTLTEPPFEEFHPF
ncbi:hypothetical protein AB0C07_23190 [Actinoplanes missouriensis]|uniref:hypothetical protein n=1 Tax=Actinoplanes missouriensis TaxID=1866 RepID=UPI0033D001E3